jgi:hypothetical protein
MGFETKVLSIVADILETTRSADFYNGSMFVDCTASQAAEIETTLLEVLSCGIIVSPLRNEFAFDFV